MARRDERARCQAVDVDAEQRGERVHGDGERDTTPTWVRTSGVSRRSRVRSNSQVPRPSARWNQISRPIEQEHSGTR
jgi:hypothetical protein